MADSQEKPTIRDSKLSFKPPKVLSLFRVIYWDAQAVAREPDKAQLQILRDFLTVKVHYSGNLSLRGAGVFRDIDADGRPKSYVALDTYSDTTLACQRAAIPALVSTIQDYSGIEPGHNGTIEPIKHAIGSGYAAAELDASLFGCLEDVSDELYSWRHTLSQAVTQAGSLPFNTVADFQMFTKPPAPNQPT